MQPRAIALRAAGVVLAISGGLVIDAYILRSHIVPDGHGLQALRLCASAIAVLGSWVAIRRRPVAASPDLAPALVRAAWATRIAGALAVSQLLMTIDCSLLAPGSIISAHIVRGDDPAAFEYLSRLLSHFETWLALALVVLPIRAAVIARHALETGASTPLRRASLSAAGAFVATSAVLALDNAVSGRSAFTEFGMRLNPVSFALHSREIRAYMPVAELVAAALVVAARISLRGVAAPEVPAEAEAEAEVEVYPSDVD